MTINDLDGKTSYSKIVAVLIGDKTFKVKAYPSLVGAALTLTTDGGEIADFQIVNLAGQVVMRQNKNDQSTGGLMQVNMGALPSGLYLVTAQNTEGVATTVKIVKQ